MALRRYLRLTRAHTAPLETVPAVGGALLATGGSVTFGVVFWGMFGILYHLAGYGHNSYSDWKNGYDKDDPNKQHHPLNSGELSPSTAKSFILGLIITAVTFTVFGLWHFGGVYGTAEYGAIAMLIGLISGVAYNEIGKETKFKFILISIAHSTVFLIPYISMGGELNTVGILAWLFVFLWVIFQISVSGEVKDIKQDEENLLKDLGTKADDVSVRPNLKTIFYAIYLRVLITFVGVLIVFAHTEISIQSIILALAVFCWGVLSSVFSFGMIDFHINDREEAISDMAKIEMMSIIMFLLAIKPTAGDLNVLAILILSGVWIIAGNRYLWGTWLAPDV